MERDGSRMPNNAVMVRAAPSESPLLTRNNAATAA
jgi:hypothetical protein